MPNSKVELRPISILDQTYLELAIASFMLDRKALRVARGTLSFYSHKLQLFTDYCDVQAIKTVEQITPQDIRSYLLWLEDNGHNPGGIHACYRVVKTFLLWVESDLEPANWNNPIRKVKPPKLAKEPIQGITLYHFRQLLKACAGQGLLDLRDSALIQFLLDTGARASEALSITLEDTDLISGRILIKTGKGHKPRYVYAGKRTRKALRAYIRARHDDNPALWVTSKNDTLGYSGLRLMLKRRAKIAGIPPPSPHDFRRCFALEYLRSGGDIFTLQKILGHADIQVLRRYLAQTDQDTQIGHSLHAPVDRL